MNPHQQNKIDLSSLSPDEQRLMRMYGKMPTKKDLLQNKLKERKYFDSGDYALSKAGKASDVGVTSIGSRHPVPENIPHLTATSPPQSATAPNPFNNGHHPPGLQHQSSHSHNGSTNRSPVKEASFLHRGTSIDDEPDLPQQQPKVEKGSAGGEGDKKEEQEDERSVSPPQAKEGLPIRR